MRTSNSINRIMIARPKIVICATFSRRRRCNPASARRQELPACMPTIRPPRSNASATTANAPQTTVAPTSAHAVSQMLWLYQTSNPMLPTPANP